MIFFFQCGWLQHYNILPPEDIFLICQEYLIEFWKTTYHFLLVIQIRRPEEAKAWGLGHSHSEDLSGVEMPHTLSANEKKSNRDCCLVQEIRRKSPAFLICNNDTYSQTFVRYLTCMSFLCMWLSQQPHEIGVLMVPFIKDEKTKARTMK